MKKRTIFIIFVVILAVIGHSFLYAQSKAVIKQITGKVEVKLPNRDWQGVWTTTGLDMHTAEEDASKLAEVDILTSDEPFIWFLSRWFRWGGLVGRGRGVAGGKTTVSVVIFELEW